MYVNVLKIEGASKVEAAIQSWLNSNPNIRIHAMSQSSYDPSDSTYWMFLVTIIYSIN